MTDHQGGRKGANGQLVRSIGFWGLAAVVLNGMVGAGVFALPGSVAHFSGSWAPLIIFGVGVALLPVVLVFAALAGLFEDTGGPLLYVREAFGPIAGFQTGWIQCLSTTASAAANANLLADYLLRLLPSYQTVPIVHAAIVLATIALVLAINLLDARHSSAWINRISVAKLIPLAMLVLLALPAVGIGREVLPASGWSLSQAILLSVYAFTGFEGGLCVAGEARDPRRDFPRALVSVFLAVAALYALIAWGYVATAYSPDVTDTAALASMATALAGTFGAVGIVVTAALSIFGNVTTTSLLVSRRLVGLAQIPALPFWFGAIRPDTGLPRNAVLFTVFVIAALALSGGFTALALLSVAARLLVYLACIAALPIIRTRRGLPHSLMGNIMVAAAVAITLFLILQSDWQAWAGLAAAIIVGFAIRSVVSRGISMRPPVAEQL